MIKQMNVFDVLMFIYPSLRLRTIKVGSLPHARKVRTAKDSPGDPLSHT
jgi:hypothetical protein